MADSISSVTLVVRDYDHMRSRGVRFTEEPRREAYGRVVVFLDLYGNKWDLVQHDGDNP